MALTRLSAHDGSWFELNGQWEQACYTYNEDIGDYATASLPVLDELATATPKKNAGVFAATSGDTYLAALQANRAYLPGYDGPVLRVRHIVTAPKYDFDASVTVKEYEDLLVEVFLGVLDLSIAELEAPHVKFHLKSPAEREFGERFTNAAKKFEVFTKCEMQGSWIYLTKS